MRTPVALLLYKRPDLTALVFAEIAKAQPPVSLIVSDWPTETVANLSAEELCFPLQHPAFRIWHAVCNRWHMEILSLRDRFNLRQLSRLLVARLQRP